MQGLSSPAKLAAYLSLSRRRYYIPGLESEGKMSSIFLATSAQSELPPGLAGWKGVRDGKGEDRASLMAQQ